METNETEPAPPRFRRIVVCLDGTAEAAYRYKKVEKKRQTNVARVSRLIKPQTTEGIKGIPQIVLYISGVGTAEGNMFFNLFNRGYGIGLDEKIIEAYCFICHNFQNSGKLGEQADEIILVGYSRGAFAARCVADMISTAGILNKTDLVYVGVLYKLWRKKQFAMPPHKLVLTNIEQEFLSKPELRRCGIRVKACALWDTVNSTFRVARFWPRRRFSFIDSEWCDGIDAVFQALALHENRRPFLPTVLKKSPKSNPADEKGGLSPDTGSQGQPGQLEQCWFVGKHSDIGRGAGTTPLANLTLIWILAKLEGYLDLDIESLWETEPVSNRKKWARKGALDKSHASSMIPSVFRNILYSLMGPGNRKPGRQFWEGKKWHEYNASKHSESFEKLHPLADAMLKLGDVRKPPGLRKGCTLPVPLATITTFEREVLETWLSNELQTLQDIAKVRDANTGILLFLLPKLLATLQNPGEAPGA